MTDLSGRVDALENQLAYFTQDLLQKIDLVTSSQNSILWNQQYTEIADTLTQVQTSLKTLQSLYLNLNLTVSRNLSLFTGHTGLPATSGHDGLA